MSAPRTSINDLPTELKTSASPITPFPPDHPLAALDTFVAPGGVPHPYLRTLIFYDPSTIFTPGKAARIVAHFAALSPQLEVTTSPLPRAPSAPPPTRAQPQPLSAAQVKAQAQANALRRSVALLGEWCAQIDAFERAGAAETAVKLERDKLARLLGDVEPRLIARSL
ncbi:hypothetical protein JCM10449v2_008042 [Rhodotorula kratochvilovae]